MVKVAIFDYGAGNIFSLKTSLEKNDAEVDVITSFDKANNYSGLLLPGVGNFDPAIKSIRDYSKTDFSDYVSDKMPVLGICKILEIDADGDANADMEISLNNVDVTDLDQDDFTTV